MEVSINHCYEIDGFKMNMGENSVLPQLQRDNLMYDRFVPYLAMLADECQGKDPSAWIVDIGANVGDTVASMIRHTCANVVCVEPTDEYYKLCQENIQGFGYELAGRIHLIKAYIAQNSEEKYVSKVEHGTAIQVKTEGNAEAPTYTLPQLLQLMRIQSEQISLIKIDTDGYDAECIMSLGQCLKNISPLFYWENQIENDEQLTKYQSLVDYLQDAGYKDFFLFDNFGNYLSHVDGNGLRNINDYLGRMMHHLSARTFFYVDVLTCKPAKTMHTKEFITKYLLENAVKNPPIKILPDYQATIEKCLLNDSCIEVMVKNISSTVWRYRDHIKLGLFSNGIDTGIRAFLSDNQDVLPGEIYVFTFTKGQYENLLSKRLEVRMLQEGACYFGEQRAIDGTEQNDTVSYYQTCIEQQTEQIEQLNEQNNLYTMQIKCQMELLETLNYQINQLLNSKSWKVTSPLRFIMNKVRKLKK